MTLTTIGSLPGGKDINDQFLNSTNLHKTRGILHRLTGPGGGGYQFGELTADYYNLTGQERHNWLTDAGTYPTNVKDAIKNAIVVALNHQPEPVPVVLTWTQNGGQPNVNVIFEPLLPKYTIAIFNCLSPVASALAERRKKKKQ